MIEIQSRPLIPDALESRLLAYSSALGPNKLTVIVDISGYWRSGFKLGDIVGDAKFRHYEVEQLPRRQWLWNLAEHCKVDLYADYDFTSEKLLKVWVHGSKLRVSFKVRCKICKSLGNSSD